MSDPEGATPEPVESDSEYEVEEIRSSKMMRGVAYYLIKWKGYTSDYDTWEPEENLLETAEELLAEYKKAHPRKEKKETAKKEKKERGKKKKEKEDEEEVAIREDSHSPPPRKKYTKKRSRRSYSSSSSDCEYQDRRKSRGTRQNVETSLHSLAWLNEGDDSESETERKRYEESAKPSKSKKSKKNEEEEESPKSPDREATPAPEANPEPIPARSPVEVDESIPTTKRHKWISSITQLSKDQDNCITVHATQGGNAVQLSLKEAMALNHELVMQHLISRYPFRDSPSE